MAILATHYGILPLTPEAAVLRLLLGLGRTSLRADEGSLLLYDPAANALVFAMTEGNAQAEAALLGQRVPIGEGWTGKAAALREVVFGSPTYRDLKFQERADGESGEPEFVLAAPMLLQGDFVGVMTVVRFDARKPFKQEDAPVLMHAASIAAIVIQQRRALLAHDSTAAGASAGLTELERQEQRLVSAVRQLVADRPDQIGGVTDLIETLARLMRA